MGALSFRCQLALLTVVALSEQARKQDPFDVFPFARPLTRPLSGDTPPTSAAAAARKGDSEGFRTTVGASAFFFCRSDTSSRHSRDTMPPCGGAVFPRLHRAANLPTRKGRSIWHRRSRWLQEPHRRAIRLGRDGAGPGGQPGRHDAVRLGLRAHVMWWMRRTP